MFIYLWPILGLLQPDAGRASEEGATPLFSFDSPSVLKQWVVKYNPLKTEGVKLSSKFATSSKNSLELEVPKWNPGTPEWPVWQTQNTFESDWTPYDRLVIDFVNPTSAVELVGIKAVDGTTSKLPGAQWPGTKVAIQPYSHLQAVIPISTFMKGLRGNTLDQSDVKTLMFYATRPASDFTVYVSRINLLKPGEEPEHLPSQFVDQLLDLRLRPALHDCHKAINETDIALQAVPSKTARDWASNRLAEVKEKLAALELKVKSSEFKLDDVGKVTEQTETLARSARRLPSLAALRGEVMKGDLSYAVGWVSSMQKVIPREMPITSLQMAPWALSVAHNETESVQIVVLPFDTELKNVRIEIGAFKTKEGRPLAPEAVTVRTVGYVNTKPVPYEVEYSGWWPDPLLDFLPTVTIAPEEAQSFWISIRVPTNQEAGLFEGEVRIIPENAPMTIRNLSIKVRDFRLSDKAVIPIAIPSGSSSYFKNFSLESWDTLKYKVADFQADYYISWDNLYIQQAPDWDVLEYLKKQGRLGLFNLYPLGFGGGSARLALEETQGEEAKGPISDLIEKIRPVYEEAKKRGLLEHAYLYGMDEAPPDLFPAVKKISDKIKAAFPDVPIVTTTHDFTQGEASQAENVDVWVPLIHEFHADTVQRARERDKKVWWYNCKTPAHPYPNQFTEYPAIELRLLHGAMSAKYQPEGFLYYSFFRNWQMKGEPPRRPIDKGPYTEWDPCALAFSDYDLYNGEGYLAYPGPDGRPLASIRLENFRDGFEDLAYWNILKERKDRLHRAGNLTSRQQQWLRDAESALKVPDDLVQSSHEFTLEPTRLSTWRERIGDLIEQSSNLSSKSNQ